MIRAGRSPHVTHHRTAAGDAVRLVDRTWWVMAGAGTREIGVWYRHPRAVETDHARVVIRDHGARVRVAAVALVLVALFVRRLR